MGMLDTSPQRQRLAQTLKRLRVTAGLSGAALAEKLGTNQSTVSRVENARQAASVALVRAWAESTGASDERREELADWAAEALSTATPWDRIKNAGLVGMQQEVGATEATVGRMCLYHPVILPGLVQTPPYAERIFRQGRHRNSTDIAGAVAERMHRQVILYDHERSFEFIVPEAALRWRMGPPWVMRGQLDRLTVVSTLENVTLTVVPQNTEAAVWHTHGFSIFDRREGGAETFVNVETLTAALDVHDPDDVQQYLDAFERLQAVGVTGDEARAVIARIDQELREEQPVRDGQQQAAAASEATQETAGEPS